MTAAHDMATNAEELSRRCQQILAGQGEATQGAVLADLLSIWLAGHLVTEEARLTERPKTVQMRAELLAGIVKLVNDLVPASEKQIMARAKTMGRA